MKTITSTDNQLIKLANKLKNRKTRDGEGLFFIEGKRSVEEVMHYPGLIRTLFVEADEQDLLADLCSMDAEKCFLLDKKLMQNICSTDTPQGIAAIVKKPSWSMDEVVAKDGMLVLLDCVSDPGNMGSIVRTCWAMGVEGLLLTPGCVDPFSPKVVRSSMGGILNVPIFQNVDEETQKQIKSLQYRFFCTDGDAVHSYYNTDLTEKCVLVMGSEAFGVGGDLRLKCDRFIKIPMNGKVDSLNVAAACAIIISESRRQRNCKSSF